jgi:hypothetical protein
MDAHDLGIGYDDDADDDAAKAWELAREADEPPADLLLAARSGLRALPRSGRRRWRAL